MSEIIMGLPVDVPADEVKQLAMARAEHHEAKSTFYAGQAKSLEREELNDPDNGRGKSANALADLNNKTDEHRSKAKHLRFLAEHLNPKATYRLDENALILLGVKPSRY
jgi:hypothetical protein